MICACEAASFFVFRIATAVVIALDRTSGRGLVNWLITEESAFSPNLRMPLVAIAPVEMAPIKAGMTRSSFRDEITSIASA